MKRKDLLSRTFLALVLTMVCININAQGKFKPFNALKNKPKIGGIVGIAGERALNGSNRLSETGAQQNTNGLKGNVIKNTPTIPPLLSIPDFSKIKPDFSKTNISKRISSILKIDKTRVYLLSLNLISTGDTIKGINFLKMAVDEGLDNAQYLYGRYCIEGQYVKKNVPLGISYIQKAAKQNNAEALAYLGDAYYFGLQGFKKDSVESVRWYEKSAKRGFFNSQYFTGNFYFNANDTTKAVNYWQMVINNKKAETPKLMTAQELQMLGNTYFNLGALYYNKQLYSLDKDAGLSFFDKAANCGHDYAAYLLSQIYHERTDVPQHERLSRNYAKMSAMLGNVEGQALYGSYCMQGYGMERDSLEAVKWLKKAASQHNADAMYTMTYVYYDAADYDSTIATGEQPQCRDSVDIQLLVGSAYYNKKQYEQTEAWLKKAAEKQNADAIWWLYDLNLSIKHDSLTAVSYLEQACEKDNPEALNNMGYYYAHGIIVKQDIEKAIVLLQKAASLNCGLAYYNMGTVYNKKELIKTPDWNKAADCFRKGAELNCPEAQYNYSLCLKKGKGVKKDKQAAKRWLEEAAKNGSEEALKELEKRKIYL